jgi:sarcosine oxidase subunit gamma
MVYDVNLQRLGIRAVIDLQGDENAIADWVKGDLPPFPGKPNSFTSQYDLTLCWIAPQRWLLCSSIDKEVRMLALTQPATAPIDISLVQVSDTLCFFSITGADATEIISIASPLDQHSSVFPSNGVSYTNIFGIKGLLMRTEDGFEIAVESSYADMIEDYLTRANA